MLAGRWPGAPPPLCTLMSTSLPLLSAVNFSGVSQTLGKLYTAPRSSHPSGLLWVFGLRSKLLHCSPKVAFTSGVQLALGVSTLTPPATTTPDFSARRPLLPRVLPLHHSTAPPLRIMAPTTLPAGRRHTSIVNLVVILASATGIVTFDSTGMRCVCGRSCRCRTSNRLPSCLRRFVVVTPAFPSCVEDVDATRPMTGPTKTGVVDRSRRRRSRTEPTPPGSSTKVIRGVPSPAVRPSPQTPNGGMGGLRLTEGSNRGPLTRQGVIHIAPIPTVGLGAE